MSVKRSYSADVKESGRQQLLDGMARDVSVSHFVVAEYLVQLGSVKTPDKGEP